MAGDEKNKIERKKSTTFCAQKVVDFFLRTVRLRQNVFNVESIEPILLEI